MKILVVDDVGFIRRRLEHMLTSHQHEVVTAESGMVALRFLSSDQTIQTVITDLHMPGMDGIELFKAAHQIERLTDNGSSKPPAFILLTAARSDSDGSAKHEALLKEAGHLGFVDVMSKPFNVENLIHRLDQIENSRRPTSKEWEQEANELLVRLHQIIQQTKTSKDEKLLDHLHTQLMKLAKVTNKKLPASASL